jgi:transcriptional regulator with XRE-family HTH domain
MSRSIHSPDHRKLCAILIAARKAASLTQGEVARRIKRPQSFVAKYEGGERRIDVIEFMAVARALEQEPRDMFAELVRSSESGKRTRR